ncbi:Uncharacterised protein [Niallia circulans]|uniref:hypothetical protein n=1 Tax=Niallia circulans TaxID=1397 RepID=UPI00077C181C|nr:hypothetical protein [Niallia circulans]MDR4318701.1 hypothetical protein [Niallia circulans]MED3839338.1 hypothetical protein [Niallia circulans]MED4245321.1 hypothetical protein [Niallia circulans]MED4250856.1 hypothetical protein [Niallia circulans]QKH60138.1 hypothetical protein FOC77_05460 [Niallia circulans]
MTARELAYLYATLKSEWKALEEVRKFSTEEDIANLLDREIAKRRTQLNKISKKLGEILILEGE